MSAPRKRLTRWTAGWSITALALVAIVAGPVQADPKSNLDEAREKVEQTEEDLGDVKVTLDDLIVRIGSQSVEVGRLQAEADALAASITELQASLAKTQSDIVQVQQRIRDAGQAIGDKQGELDRRARVAYVYGPGKNVEFILGSTSLGDLTTRLQIVNRVAESDRDLIDQISEHREDLQEQQGELEQLQDRQLQQEADLEVQQAELYGRLDAAEAALAELEASKAAADAMVASLQDQLERANEQERLAQAEYDAELARLAELAKQRGQGIPGAFVVCPVDHPNAYSDSFGAPRYTGGYHPHAGNDIMAPMGTPIRAPFPGTAVDATNWIGGLSVTVQGDAGYVYNAHLSAFGTLGRVEAGDIIGYVGDTGNAKGTSPHDHFEWHPDVIPANPHVSPYGLSVVGDAIDPYPYLNAVC